MEQKWLKNAEVGNLKEMKEIIQRSRSHGLLQEVKNFKNSSGSTALHWATIEGHLDICQFLVREELVDVNAKNVYGFNALHFAARENRPEITKWLLEETSIGVNAQSKDGWSALHYAAIKNSLEVTRILLKYRPRHLKDKENYTAFDLARMLKKEEIFQLLKTHYDL